MKVLVILLLLFGSSVDAKTLDFRCEKHLKGKSQAECIADATEQLAAMGCQVAPVESGDILNRVTCGFAGERSNCGIMKLVNCSFAGGSKDGKSFSYGGNQAYCSESYGKGATYKRNPSKNSYFPGICVLDDESPTAGAEKAGTKKVER